MLAYKSRFIIASAISKKGVTFEFTETPSAKCAATKDCTRDGSNRVPSAQHSPAMLPATTVMRFSVSVPVLSEQIVVQPPGAGEVVSIREWGKETKAIVNGHTEHTKRHKKTTG